MIFRSAGSGYMQTPTGPRCPVMSKDNDELVPSFEIAKIINLLEIPQSVFLAMLDGCTLVKSEEAVLPEAPKLDN